MIVLIAGLPYCATSANMSASLLVTWKAEAEVWMFF